MGPCALIHKQGISGKQCVAHSSEGKLEPQEEPSPECQISEELKGAIAASQKAVRNCLRGLHTVSALRCSFCTLKGDAHEGCERTAGRDVDCERRVRAINWSVNGQNSPFLVLNTLFLCHKSEP